MRTGATIIHTSLSPSSSSSAPIHSPWHSPIPYLFGGLAAMLGLIVFALLILACSYWKLSEFLADDERSRNDLENGDDDDDDKLTEEETVKVEIVYEEKIVVIMAGDIKPSYLATPIIIHPNTTQVSKNEDEMNSLDEKKKEEEEESDVREETESREAIENPHHQSH